MQALSATRRATTTPASSEMLSVTKPQNSSPALLVGDPSVCVLDNITAITAKVQRANRRSKMVEFMAATHSFTEEDYRSMMVVARACIARRLQGETTGVPAATQVQDNTLADTFAAAASVKITGRGATDGGKPTILPRGSPRAMRCSQLLVITETEIITPTPAEPFLVDASCFPQQDNTDPAAWATAPLPPLETGSDDEFSSIEYRSIQTPPKWKRFKQQFQRLFSKGTQV